MSVSVSKPLLVVVCAEKCVIEDSVNKLFDGIDSDRCVDLRFVLCEFDDGAIRALSHRLVHSPEIVSLSVISIWQKRWMATAFFDGIVLSLSLRRLEVGISIDEHAFLGHFLTAVDLSSSIERVRFNLKALPCPEIISRVKHILANNGRVLAVVFVTPDDYVYLKKDCRRQPARENL